MKKIIMLLILILSLTSVLFLSGCGTLKDGPIYLQKDGDSYTVVGCDDIPEEIIVHSSYAGFPVNKVGYGAFKNLTSVTSIVFEEGIKIMDMPIQDCPNLTKISIPNSLEECERLFSSHAYELKYTVEFNEYGNSLYLGNSSNPYVLLLKGYDIAEGCRVICGDDTFASGSFGDYDLNIPASVVYISKYAFSFAHNVYHITVDPNNKNYDSRENCDCLIETKTNTLICAGRALTFIPNTVEVLEYEAFSGFDGRSIEIPGSVKVICEYCFFNAWHLEEVKLNEGLKEIQESAFNSCRSLKSISLPNTLSKLGERAFYGCEQLEEIYMPAMVIPSDCFPSSLKVIHYGGTLEQWNKFYNPEMGGSSDIMVYTADGKVYQLKQK